MREFGYTVLKKDENGNDLPEVDWSKSPQCRPAPTVSISTSKAATYGIVDPADKYELEEQIITDLYSYKDKKTGKRIVSVALHNKDAVLLGMGGTVCC